MQVNNIISMEEIRYVNDSDLNERNFMIYAAQHYENKHCHDMEEFYTDLQIPLHLKKLLTRYHVNGVLKSRLIINHVVSLFNVFEPIAACKILFFKIEEKYYSYLKTILIYLDRCPEYLMINGKLVNLKQVPIDDMLLMGLKSGE